MPKKKYITNENLLREIHKSKNSYCSYIDPKYEDYHIILESKEQITPELKMKIIQERIEKREGIPAKQQTRETNQNRIQEDDRNLVVFRVYTDEHIPPQFRATDNTRMRYVDSEANNQSFQDLEESADRKTKNKRKTQHSKTPDPQTKSKEQENRDLDLLDSEGFFDRNNRLIFRPFKHYILDDKTGEIIEVGRSHWKGDLVNGRFCQSHGKITDELGRMILLLVERYSQRGNWRSYTYLEEMRGCAIVQLCQIALKFDELKSSNPFAYYTSSISNSFTKILNIEKRAQHIKDDILMDSGFDPSYGRQLDEERREKQNLNGHGGSDTAKINKINRRNISSRNLGAKDTKTKDKIVRKTLVSGVSL